MKYLKSNFNKFLFLYIVGLSFLFCFERLWGYYSKFVYFMAGMMGFFIILYFFFKRKAWSHLDTGFIFMFFLWCVISAFANYGFSPDLLATRYFFIWIILFSFYFLILYLPNSDVFLKYIIYAMVFGLTLLNLFVLIHASASLMHSEKTNLFYGCFRVGRLTGIGNANPMGIGSCFLAMLALYSLLMCTKKLLQFFFVFAVILGIINLGLTNCRTAVIGFSFSVGLLVFSYLFRLPNYKEFFKRYHFGRPLLEITSLFLALFAIAGSFLICYIQPYFYRFVLQLYGQLTHNAFLLHNLENVFVRPVNSNIDTLTDRTLIWKKVLSDTFSKSRLTWFGISNRSVTPIYGVYDGKHEIETVHSHNAYLEALRRNGLPGFTLILLLSIYWLQSIIPPFFKKESTISDTYLASIVFASFLMGISELIPFSFYDTHFYNIPFFIACGYFVSARRKQL